MVDYYDTYDDEGNPITVEYIFIKGDPETWDNPGTGDRVQILSDVDNEDRIEAEILEKHEKD